MKFTCSSCVNRKVDYGFICAVGRTHVLRADRNCKSYQPVQDKAEVMTKALRLLDMPDDLRDYFNPDSKHFACCESVPDGMTEREWLQIAINM
jgi:hypothetical protein